MKLKDVHFLRKKILGGSTCALFLICIKWIHFCSSCVRIKMSLFSFVIFSSDGIAIVMTMSSFPLYFQDESVEGVLTILCNHSFHGSCLSKWSDTTWVLWSCLLIAYRKGYGGQSRGTFQRRGGTDMCVVCTAVNSSVGLKQLNLKLGMHLRQFYNLKIGSLVCEGEQ